MARPALQHDKNTDDDVIDVIPDDISDLERDGDEQIAAVLGELGASERDREISLQYYRVLPGKGKMAYLFAAVPAELPLLDRIVEKYGSGDYACRVLINNKLAKLIRFSVQAPKDMAQKSNSEMSEILRSMAESQQRLFDQMMQMQSRHNPVATDTMTQMTSMLAMFTQMKEFLQPAQPQQNSLDMFLKTVEVVKDLMPERGGGSETNILDVVRDVFKSDAFTAAIGALTKPQPINITPGVTQISAPHQPAAPVQEGNANMIQQQMIKRQLAGLLEQAKKNKNPELYAELILDNFDENLVREHFLNEHAIDNAIIILPEIAQHRPWFTALQNALAAFLSDESGEGEIDEGGEELPIVQPPES